MDVFWDALTGQKREKKGAKIAYQFFQRNYLKSSECKRQQFYNTDIIRNEAVIRLRLYDRIDRGKKLNGNMHV